MKSRLADKWAEYEKLLSPKAGPVQIQETRRAFYAGAATMFGLVNAASADPLTVDDGAEILSELEAEMLAYARGAREGRW